MKYRILLLISLSYACQTHRIRNISLRDSLYRQTAAATMQREKATTQSIRQHWTQQLTDSTAVVILPTGPITYHPSDGFKGEASAIVTYSTKNGYSTLKHDQKTNHSQTQTFEQAHTSDIHTHSQERESLTERQPLAGFSFRWLAIAGLAGCLLLFVFRYYKRY